MVERKSKKNSHSHSIRDHSSGGPPRDDDGTFSQGIMARFIQFTSASGERASTFVAFLGQDDILNDFDKDIAIVRFEKKTKYGGKRYVYILLCKSKSSIKGVSIKEQITEIALKCSFKPFVMTSRSKDQIAGVNASHSENTKSSQAAVLFWDGANEQCGIFK